MCPRWRRSCAQQPSLWLLGLSICCCLALLVPLLLYSTPSQLLGAAPAFGCDPNGRVFVDTGRHFVPSRWSSAYTLGVTMGFGQLTYTAAKSTDEAWNLVVARGGQLLGGLLVYRTFRKPVGLALSQHRAPYRTALALQYAPVSVDSFWQYSREALRQDRHKYFGMFASIMLIISTIFVLVAPTWLSAMTGYRAVMRAMFPWEGGIYVPSEKLSYCWTVLQGAARVGLRNKICAPVGGDLSDAVADCESTATLNVFMPFPSIADLLHLLYQTCYSWRILGLRKPSPQNSAISRLAPRGSHSTYRANSHSMAKLIISIRHRSNSCLRRPIFTQKQLTSSTPACSLTTVTLPLLATYKE